MAYHGSFIKYFLRALLGVISSLGFGFFWYALIFGISANIGIFLLGILFMVIGIAHMVLAIKKQLDYHRRYDD
ncbi:MAG: hypothetical protein J6B29_03795 [Clostridia bacterium]|nr:hypothetical protein [Clostridia bacterium]